MVFIKIWSTKLKAIRFSRHELNYPVKFDANNLVFRNFLDVCGSAHPELKSSRLPSPPFLGLQLVAAQRLGQVKHLVSKRIVKRSTNIKRIMVHSTVS
uniref:Uncharacterized protein n=1 Tax=Tetranychus urticae TaxID=32264 RepID=T1KIT7_TETUR